MESKEPTSSFLNNTHKKATFQREEGPELYCDLTVISLWSPRNQPATFRREEGPPVGVPHMSTPVVSHKKDKSKQSQQQQLSCFIPSTE
jgi:hypothetical protein